MPFLLCPLKEQHLEAPTVVLNDIELPLELSCMVDPQKPNLPQRIVRSGQKREESFLTPNFVQKL